MLHPGKSFGASHIPLFEQLLGGVSQLCIVSPGSSLLPGETIHLSVCRSARGPAAAGATHVAVLQGTLFCLIHCSSACQPLLNAFLQKLLPNGMSPKPLQELFFCVCRHPVSMSPPDQGLRGELYLTLKAWRLLWSHLDVLDVALNLLAEPYSCPGMNGNRPLQ